jgi:hypothetical protein
VKIYQEICRRKPMGRSLESKLDQVADLRVTWDRLFKYLNENLTPEAVRRRAMDEQKRLGRAIRDGNHPGVTIHDVASALSHAEGEKQAVKLQLADLGEEAAILEAPIWAHVAQSAKALGDELEAAEAKEYEAYGVGFCASELLHALRSASDTAYNRATRDPKVNRGSKPGNDILNLK